MRFWSHRRRRRVGAATVIALAVSTLVVLAIRYDGEPIHDVDLNDGSVWVTKQGMLGRLNSQVKELDLGLMTSATTEDVFQEGASVQAFDEGGGGAERVVHLVDPVRGRSTRVTLPSTYRAVTGKGTAAIIDEKTGKAWLRPLGELESFSDELAADVKLSPRGTVTITRSGTALFLDRNKGQVRAWSTDVSGSPVEVETYDFDTEFIDGAQLTAVGEKPVVAQAGKVLLPGEDPIELGEDVVLQEVGPSSDDVYASTRAGLFRIPLGGGDAEEQGDLDVDGRPAPPAVVAGCVHAAWAHPGTDNYLRVCDDRDPVTDSVPDLGSTEARLVFRSNRDVVVLNDVASGLAWLVQKEGMTLVDNWNAVDPRAPSPQKSDLSKIDESDLANQRPVAVEDAYGARAGSTVLLPVTLNDKDADGDLLTVTGAPAATGGATFSVVGNGTQVQAGIPQEARGKIRFEYEVNDGWPQNPGATAPVEISVVPPEVDRKPALMEHQHNVLTVTDGHTASVNVLPAWIDPDGDALVLEKATSKDGAVSFRPDGTIDFTDEGNGPGTAKIDFEVRGGTKVAKGSVAVTVAPEDKAAPHPVADRFTGGVNSSILLEPLKNDTDPFGGEMSVSRLLPPEGTAAEVVLNSERGTATFKASRHGTYYLEYEAVSEASGRSAELALIRVDVVPDRDDNLPPVATRDLAVVRPDEPVLVDVLANDTDPDNDVLVVQGIEVRPEYQHLVKASLVEKRFVRVETTAPLGDQRPEFTYLLSDGSGAQVEGTVSVSPGEAGKNRPPIARDDVVNARAGTIIDIPVLDDDEDPDGDKLSVNQADLEDGEGGTAISDGKVPIIADGDSIRVMVPDTDQLTLSYGVRDSSRVRHDAQLVLNIKPDSAKGNQAPRPQPIVDRTVVGQRIRVPVDTFEADPDGDPVVFAGVSEPPTLGRIGRTGTNWFDYEPFEDGGRTGTDSFKVLVKDAYGKTGVVQVRIGVAPRTEQNQPPAALDDEVLVKPGRTVRFPVMLNDTDPDGDRLSIDRRQFAKPEGVEGGVVGGAVELTAPDLDGRSEATATAQYAVTDGLGVSSPATLQLTAREDAPDHAPLAQDDIARPHEVDGKRAGDTVDVDVLANDGDLDGPRSELRLTSLDPKLARVVDGKLRITLGKQGGVVPYRVTDGTEQSSFGFVSVPGTQTMPPTLDTTAVPIEVVAGKERSVDLDDVIVVRPDRSPRIGRVDEVFASKGNVRPRGREGFVFSAAPDEHGLASVTLPVIDGEDLNDPTGLDAQITVPINVLPSKNLDPVARSVSLTVLAGAQPTPIDLSRLATDPNPDDELAYDIAEGQDGLDAKLERGGRLVLSAGESAPSSEQDLVLRVEDDAGGSTRTTISVQVVGRPEEGEETVLAQPMTLGPLTLPDAKVGSDVEVDVRKAILLDPFPDKQKQILKASASNGAKVSREGTKLRITPAAAQTVVTYTLSDGSGARERAAVGQVTVVAASAPARPGTPKATPAGASSVTVTWQAPADNGRPVTGYVVSYDGGSTRCTSTSCLVEGLKPGKSYRFRVTAVNEVDSSPPSAPSNAVTPDEAPGRMAAPRIANAFTDRNGRLHLSWRPPENKGSPIVRYEFQASPRTASGQVDLTVGANQRSRVWTGLRNGTHYRFKVRAVNGGGRGVGPWSAPSRSAQPFTRPSVMSAPALKAVNNGSTDGKGYLTVSWPGVGSPNDGYDRVGRYELALFRNGRLATTMRVDGRKTSHSFEVANGASWAVQVRAGNRAGMGGWSGRSVSQITWDKSAAPTSIAAAAHCSANATCAAAVTNYYSVVQFRTPTNNGGWPVTYYDYITSDGQRGRFKAATTRTGTMTRATIRFRTAGWPHLTPRTVQLIPISSVSGRLVPGTASGRAGRFFPWAKPTRPVAAEVGYKYVVFNCLSGNGRPVNPLNVRVHQSGYTSTTSRNDYGCVRHRITWNTLPASGNRKCAVIRVQNSVARSVDSPQVCTKVAP